MDGLLFEPLKYYSDYARDAHKENVSSHFDSLLSASQIDIEQNRKTVSEYDLEMAKVEKINGKLRGYRIGVGFLVALIVIGFIAFVIGVCIINQYRIPSICAIIGGILGVIVGFVVIFAVLRPKIKHHEELKNKHLQRAQELKNVAFSQMALLNALFDGGDTLRLIEKTMPQIKFDLTYSTNRERELIEEYDYVDMTDEETSVIDTLGGTMLKNPFLYERYLDHTMGTQTYTGTLTISWRVAYRDSEGRLRYRTRTQVLHASVTKPKPYYTVCTHLGYGCDAAPDLSFSRNESDTDELSERALARRIKKGEKKLKDRAEKSISKGGGFQEMVNSEFDVLFGAHNRNHEVQFRLMYTPLAQNNTVDLLRSKQGYGDDFNIIKQGRYNIVKSNHAQAWDMARNGSRFCSYSVDIARRIFQEYNEEYFKSVFFDFAPLLAVPAYQDPPAHFAKEPRQFANNYNYYEYECLANAIGDGAFAHSDTKTRSILKAQFVDKRGDVDRVAITAHSYKTIKRVDYVSVLGGDGRMHLVPVHWIEYIPITKISQMAVKSLGITEKQLRDKGKSYPQNACYLHGLLAYQLNGEESWEDIEKTFNQYT